MQQKPNIFIVYHNHCLDGFMSALLWYYAHGLHTELTFSPTDKDVIFVPSNYGEATVQANEHDHVVILDFSYPLEIIRDLDDRGVCVTMYDHHESVIKSYTPDYLEANGFKEHYIVGSRYHTLGLGDESVGDSVIRLVDNRCCAVEDRKSAAGLVISFFHSKLLNCGLMLPSLGELIYTAKLAERHDTWQHDGARDDLASYLSAWFYHWIKQEKDTVESLKAKPEESYAKFVELVDKFMAIPLLDKLSQGKQIVTDDFKDVVYLVGQNKHDYRYDATASRVAVITLPDNVRAKNISMMGSYLCKEQGYDIALMLFRLENTDNYVVSMRSDQNKQNVDVSALATLCKTLGIAFTGGGHRNAAGMTVHKDNLPRLLDLFVDLEKDV